MKADDGSDLGADWPPKSLLNILARRLLPLAREFYSHEENRRAYAEYMAEQKKKGW